MSNRNNYLVKRNKNLLNMPVSEYLRHNKVSSDKKILIVEDNELNRDILKAILQSEFEVMEASNGQEGIEMLQKYRQQLEIVILDIYMPVCDGFEFLEKTQSDPYLAAVPVIVSTGSERREDEERCIKLGATDFIGKTYNPEVIIGRIKNIIRLKESLSTLAVVEFDRMTGLYNMSAFYHHTEQIIKLNEGSFDLVMVNIINFMSINATYGEKVGDEILIYLAQRLKEHYKGAIISRTGDNFYILTESWHRENEKECNAFVASLESDGPISNLRISFGVYPDVDKSATMIVLCGRAKMAAGTVDSSSSSPVGWYTDTLRQRYINEQNMITGFDDAIANKEFKVWLQPKIDIATGEIIGAEALVRWISEEYGLIMPGVFIPIFEKEGLISRIDQYVFREICQYQKKRKESGKRLIPISINLSRKSLFDSNIVNIYRDIINQFDINMKLVPIEITESVAMSDSSIGEICGKLVNEGFQVQMDDFGSGFSSLASLAMLPFSAIKIDKTLIDSTGNNKGNIIVKGIVDAVRDLGVKVVAEGVETVDQVEFLSMIHCDQLQGYYYSKPIPEEEFDKLMEQTVPFAEKHKVAIFSNRGILRITGAELPRYLKVFRVLFSDVRIVSEDGTYQNADTNGILGNVCNACYEIWNRRTRCENCTTLRCLETRKTVHKFEILENEIFIVYSVYIEVDGIPSVIELLNRVGNDILFGYQNEKTLMEIIKVGSDDIYKDIQLHVYNRRFLEECSSRMKNINAIAIIDIDKFKNVNDTYGHIAGDEMLNEIIESIKRLIRNDDFIIRIGGDEFIIAFENMQDSHFEEKLENIRKKVYEIVVEDYPEIKVSVTIGGTMCEGYSREAFERADGALYEGKKERNKVVVR